MNKMNPTPAMEAEPKVPTDLHNVLAATPIAKAKWSDLTLIGRRDFITWVDAAKQPVTRQRRIEKMCSMLAAGKRRPCCYSIVPLDLHHALAAAPLAKATWSQLTPTERRDLISGVDSADGAAARRRQIEKACGMLAAGKRKRGR